MTAGRYKDAWYGRYVPGVTASARTFTIKVNARSLDAVTTTAELPVWSKSTATHELGHTLRLKDKPKAGKHPETFDNASLMNHGRNRSVVGSPTAYDKAYVKACYA